MLANIWNTLLFHPFLNILTVSYNILWDNLGLAVIFIAILVRVILIPSVRSQTEMTRKMASLKPELEKLQKKYANNQQMLAQEQMKLYKKVGYNPLGCLSSFLPQILMLYAIIQVINVVTNNNFEGLYTFVREWVFNGAKDIVINTQFLNMDLAKNFTIVSKELGYFNFSSISLFLLAVLVGATQYLSTKFMQHLQGQTVVKRKGSNEQSTPEELQSQMMNSMNVLFPFMTFFITLTTPAVLGLYWLAQSVMLIVQYFFIDKKKSLEALALLTKFNKK
ncbi:MAG: Preprotein translocase YidC subunit [candidate division WS6 bacterium GW2011_GWF2_39_15]|uniref:Preprotein translocase YidC subunit n=1 Tax=candidate division WS6 bacterium GW2011_GWF2_39_15 TaxID=1619100 RepID=A0A0G0MQT1_9BACT|nr:MAG: Preprotein translocase YidC subunit [candidate division WS6 bacterium GW2011_GWF2_39_15]